MLGVCSVSASEFVKVPSSVNCTVGQDCILNCTFNVTAGGGWGERSAVIWTRAETHKEVHIYENGKPVLTNQLLQYVNRTSLSDSELQRGDASLLLRRVTQEDAGKYRCVFSTPRMDLQSEEIELVLVPANPSESTTQPPIPADATTGQPNPAEPRAPAVLKGRHHWFALVPVLLLLCVTAGLIVWAL
ncbi:UNVERIFIED_CONTAM: hypothetical protein FKN15_048627 [Acipenser sinensis]